MSKTIPVGVSASEMASGEPTGTIHFLPIPEPTLVAISDAAAKRGMTVAQAIAKALHDFCEKQGG